MNRQIYVPDAPRFILLLNAITQIVYLYEYLGVFEGPHPNTDYFNIAGDRQHIKTTPIDKYEKSDLPSVRAEWRGDSISAFKERAIGGLFYGMYFDGDNPPH